MARSGLESDDRRLIDKARIVKLDDGIEVLLLEGKTGVRLDSYRRAINAPTSLKVSLWPTKASRALSDKRFPTVEALIAALRLELRSTVRGVLRDRGIAL